MKAVEFSLQDPDSGEFTGYPGSTCAELDARFPELVWPDDAHPEGWWNRPFEPYAARSIRVPAAYWRTAAPPRGQ